MQLSAVKRMCFSMCPAQFSADGGFFGNELVCSLV